MSQQWLLRAKTEDDASKIVIHETLHEVINDQLGIVNTAFTEALFDFLCGRGYTGLWFAEEFFNQISEALQ